MTSGREDQERTAYMSTTVEHRANSAQCAQRPERPYWVKPMITNVGPIVSDAQLLTNIVLFSEFQQTPKLKNFVFFGFLDFPEIRNLLFFNNVMNAKMGHS